MSIGAGVGVSRAAHSVPQPTLGHFLDGIAVFGFTAYMSHADSEAHDTFLTPVLFADGQDRRTGARVSYDEPIRVGPPYGKPHAMVAASDVSVGGLFILADREVRVGARFSVSIPHPEGKAIEIPEAEVVYNRGTPHVSGFGVRFAHLTEAAVSALERLVAARESSLEGSLFPSTPPSDVPSDAPTVVPPSHPIEGVSFSEADDRIFQDSDALSFASAMSPDADLERWGIQRVSATPGRSDQVYWVAGAIGMALVVVVLAVTLLTDRTNEAVASERGWQTGNVRTVTHQVLMGERDIRALDEVPDMPVPEATAVPSSKKPSAPLPELVTVDRLLGAEGTPPKAVPKTRPKAENRPSPPQGRARKTQKVKKAPWKPKKVRPAELRPGEVSIDLPVTRGVRVKRTAVYERPHRFVIDLTGEMKTPELPPGEGTVRRVRFGRHDGFTRYVLDVDRPIEVGRVTKFGHHLQVVLHHR